MAGFRGRTVVKMPGLLTAYTLDEVAMPGARSRRPARVPCRRRLAGSDGWAPDFAVGDAHVGDWRQTTIGAPGQAVGGTAQWLSTADPLSGASVFLVMERNDYASSTMAYDGAVAAAEVDLARDLATPGRSRNRSTQRRRRLARAAAGSCRPVSPSNRCSRASRSMPTTSRGSTTRYLTRERGARLPQHGDVQHRQRRWQSHLDRREGRHGSGRGPPAGRGGAATRRRDVHPR